jgi:hypothetical protein
LADTVIDSDSIAEQKPKVFSAPRRFDLATIFAVSIAYAMLFGLLRYGQMPPIVFAIVPGYFTVIAVAQALLFKGKRPRVASVLTGLTLSVGFFYYGQTVGRPVRLLLFVAAFGAFIGYVGGVIVGLVLLIAYAVRSDHSGRTNNRNVRK